MSIQSMVQGNLLPALRATLTKADGTPQDLTGATVRLHVEKPDGTLLFDHAATVENAALGIVRYDWQSGDTATPGRYPAEFQATIGGLPFTFPNTADTPLVIVILAQIAP